MVELFTIKVLQDKPYLLNRKSIVELNNELQNIRIKEQQEIERILMMLSAKIGEYSSELETIVYVSR